MSWHHRHLLRGRPETLPANNIGDPAANDGGNSAGDSDDDDDNDNNCDANDEHCM